MPKGELFFRNHDGITPVNGSLSEGWVDAYLQWGVSLTDSALSALMTPAPNKSVVENNSRIEHGKRVIKNPVYSKKDERDVNLEMHINAKDKTDFFDKYDRFCSEVLDYGFIDIKSVYMPTKVFKMTYVNCSQFTEFIQQLARFTLRLNEPNPKDRSI